MVAHVVHSDRLWKLVDSVEGLMNFGIVAVQSPLQLVGLASDLWRLNIGRPSILRYIFMPEYAA
jgi:hypothetical protein